MRHTAIPSYKGKSLHFVENFLFAGSSALILSVAHTHAHYWFISVFALLPFFWRLTRVNFSGSIVLGIILAHCYAFVVSIDQILVSPWSFVSKLLLLSLIFSAFGVAVNRVKSHIGFHPVFIAVLWLPLEYLLTHHAHLGSIFTFSETDSTLLIRIGSLFGILTISFAVVLINSLVLILLSRVVQGLRSRAALPAKDNQRLYLPFKQIIIERRFYYYAVPRAPPRDRSLHSLKH